MTHLIALAATALTALAGPADVPADAAYCREARITGYVRSEYGPRTYDGTPIGTEEAIAAASWDIPIDSYVTVDGLGTYRIADRGLLGSNGWIDIAVWSRPEAYAITGYRQVCVSPPGGG